MNFIANLSRSLSLPRFLKKRADKPRRSLLSDCRGEGYLDMAMKILIVVVVGAAILVLSLIHIWQAGTVQHRAIQPCKRIGSWS